MLVITIISQALLYLCISICTGSFILSIVKVSQKPKINVPKNVMLLAIGGVAILSFIPLLPIIQFISSRIGFMEGFKSVIFTYDIGLAWVYTLLTSFLLFVFVRLFDHEEQKNYGFIGLILVILVIVSLGWSSHASSIDAVWGLISDTLHLIAVSAWVGTLFVVSWFSKNQTNWSNFLKWFSPLAISCFLMTMITGFILMTFMMEFEKYTSSWMIPYGQSLLIKHILIIPLIIYAFINSILIRNKLKRAVDFNPKPWAKAESLIILLIFAATASLGQQSPPKEIIISNETVSPLFTNVYQGQFTPEMVVQLSLNPISLLFLLSTTLFFILMMFSFIWKTTARYSFMMSIYFTVSVYLTFMFSIE